MYIFACFLLHCIYAQNCDYFSATVYSFSATFEKVRTGAKRNLRSIF